MSVTHGAVGLAISGQMSYNSWVHPVCSFKFPKAEVSFGRCPITLSYLDVYRTMFNRTERTFGKLYPAVFPDNVTNECTKEDGKWLDAYQFSLLFGGSNVFRPNTT